jgi:penicillin-binding protein 1A
MNVEMAQHALGGKGGASMPPFGSRFVCYSPFSRTLGRNLLGNEDRSFKRSFKEMLAAERVEAALDKPRILQVYLNWIYLGRGAYGVAAAARRHFGKPLAELTVEEAAYLAGLTRNPTLDAGRNYQKALERRNWVIEQMINGRLLSRQEAEAAAARPLTVIPLSR